MSTDSVNVMEKNGKPIVLFRGLVYMFSGECVDNVKKCFCIEKTGCPALIFINAKTNELIGTGGSHSHPTGSKKLQPPRRYLNPIRPKKRGRHGMDCGTEPVFMLRWRSHEAHLASYFKHLRQTGIFADMTISCQGRSIPCHKFILSSSSKFFEKVLIKEHVPHPTVILPEFEFEDVNNAIELMYCGGVYVDKERISLLIAVTKFFQIKGFYPPRIHSVNPDDDVSSSGILKSLLSIDQQDQEEVD